jgi:uncharacterized oxidoreductase
VPTFPPETLTDFAREVFTRAGVPADEAAIVATSLVGAHLAGHDSHGLIRIPQYLKAMADGILRAGVPLSIANETPAVLACDAGWGLGQVQAHRLLDRLVPKARAIGLAAGTLRHCGHIGRLGEYGERIAGEGLAFLATVNNHGFARAVAPPGGVEARIGTNPLCLAVPLADADPVVLDIGTSVCAEGKVRVLFNRGVPAPEGWLHDAEGKPTTDPGVLYREPRGTILPLGGPQAYKGFGIGLLLDMFVGGFSGGPCSRPEIGPLSANAVFFLVLDPAHFAGLEHFRTEVTNLAANVRGCRPTVPGTPILLPGDPERRARAQRRQEGITIDDGTWKQLAEIAGRLDVTLPSA